MNKYAISYLILVLLIPIKSFGTSEKELPKKVESDLLSAPKNENDSKDHKLISLLYAFMIGKIHAHQDQTVRYSHYDRKDAHYTQTIQQAHDTLRNVHLLMRELRIHWKALPIELEINKISQKYDDDATKKAVFIAKFSSLTQEEKAQLESMRFHEYMHNYDLKESGISEEERVEIVKNRDALKKAFMPQNAIPSSQWEKINEAAARKLNHKPMPNISEFVQEVIEVVKNI